MIGFLKGHLVDQDSSSLLIETGGLGYEVLVSSQTSMEFQKNNPISLWIYTCVRPDSMELFGFSSLKEKKFFISLLKVKGIGPKMALKILGSCSIDQFAMMISEENIKALSALPKIGKKTAQQIILSLKEEVSDHLIGSSPNKPHGEKLFFALEKLGFQSNEIKEVLRKIDYKEDMEKDLKQALSLLKLKSKV